MLFQIYNKLFADVNLDTYGITKRYNVGKIAVRYNTLQKYPMVFKLANVNKTFIGIQMLKIVLKIVGVLKIHQIVQYLIFNVNVMKDYNGMKVDILVKNSVVQ